MSKVLVGWVSGEVSPCDLQKVFSRYPHVFVYV